MFIAGGYRGVVYAGKIAAVKSSEYIKEGVSNRQGFRIASYVMTCESGLLGIPKVGEDACEFVKLCWGLVDEVHVDCGKYSDSFEIRMSFDKVKQEGGITLVESISDNVFGVWEGSMVFQNHRDA